ncbi:MAG TPA: trypsin-like peptidase domain-containing protein [Myxococcaceae bacterium]|nr:trypsin-like peptidase domain-containing protein [Myxococcaceae bacterium]
MAVELKEISSALASLVEENGVAVARVEGRRRRASSGIVLSPGMVIAANHAVERDEDIRVSFDGEETRPAELVGRDAGTDLALLRVEGEGGSTRGWSDATELRVGNLVLALGRPGRTVRAAFGIVSALAEGWKNPAGSRLERYVEADLALPAGFSGAAVVDASGALVGMATTGMIPGASMIVPVSTLRQVAQALEAHGGIRRGYLGIGSYPVRLQGSARTHSQQEIGLLIFSVEPGSPAEQGGVLLGDVLLALDGSPLKRMEDLLGALSDDRVGREAVLRVLRSGAVRELTVTIGERR